MRRHSRNASCVGRSTGRNNVLLLLVVVSCLCFLVYTHLSFKWIKQEEWSGSRSSLRVNEDTEVTGKFSLDASQHSEKACKHPNLLVVVLASTRFFPLLRLLISLKNAKYECAQVNLHVSIDVPKSTQMLPFMRSVVDLANFFEWPHGQKTMQQALVHRGLSLSWFEAILPCQDDYILILEDDMEVSHYFFMFFSAVANKPVSRDERLASICLHPTWGLDPAVIQHMFDSTYWLAVKYACSWGPIWTRLALLRFRIWLLKNYGVTKPYVPGLTEINKYVAQGRDVQSSWTTRFLFEAQMFTLLHRVELNSDCLQGTFLLLNHKEPGLHIKRKQSQYTDASLLLTRFETAGPALEALPLTNCSISDCGGSRPGFLVRDYQTSQEMDGAAATLKARYEAEKNYSLQNITSETCWLNSSCHLDSKKVKRVLVSFTSRGMLIGKRCLGIPDSVPLDMASLLFRYVHGMEKIKSTHEMGTSATISLKGLTIVSFRESRRDCGSFLAEQLKSGAAGTVNCFDLHKGSSWESGPGGRAVEELSKPKTTNIASTSSMNLVSKLGKSIILKEFANTSVVLLKIDVYEVAVGLLRKVICHLKPHLPRFLSLRLYFSLKIEEKLNFLPDLITEIYGRGYICSLIDVYPESVFDAMLTLKPAAVDTCNVDIKSLNEAVFLPAFRQLGTTRLVELLCFSPRDLIPVFTYNI